MNVFKYGIDALNLNLTFIIHYLIKNKIDVIHVHYGTVGNNVSIYKEILPKIKLVTTFHGYDIRLGLEKGGQIYTRLFNRADKLIAISNYNYKSLIEIGAPEKKIVKIPNGLYLNHYASIPRAIMPSDKIIRILSVGRLVKEKGYEYGLRAIKEILRKHNKLIIKYTIIGEGEHRKTIENLVKKLNLEKEVVLLGRKNSLGVCEEMKINDIFMLSSIQEALPTVLIEAQAAAMPIIATNVGSVEDMMENNKSGIIVKSENEDDLIDGLSYLIGNREKWYEMGCYGRQYVKNKFGIDAILNKLVNVYDEP